MSPNLVFASGVLVPQKIGRFEYFKGLAKVYPAETTLFFPVSALGTVQERAAELAKAIAAKFPTGDVHIVAHSMGGLDSRCLLAQDLEGLASGKRVVSLSTISTPHRGSPLADLLLGPLGALEIPLRHFLDEIPAVLANNALVDLSTKNAPGFKAKEPVEGVRYFSYAGHGVGSKLLYPLYEYVKAKEGDNDGVVSLTSAAWPGELTEEPWEADHLAEIGYDLNRPDLTTPFPHKEAIARVVATAVG
jgi:triacylglycerol lipase